MLVKPDALFKDALLNHYAVGAFNISNLEVAQAIIWAAQSQNSPVIVQTSEGAIEYGGLQQLTAIVRTLSDELDLPIVLHLDHGKSLETAKACIEAGYTSVMIDASKEDFKTNIEMTAEVVAFAHKQGVWVEAELGAILGKEGAVELKGGTIPDDMLTDPKQAREFVEKTGVDALAVSVGTIHGAFTGQEYIRFEVLEEVQKQIPDTPLVLHGASGLADKHLQEAVKTNVCKVNVDTELRIAFEDAVKAYFSESHDGVDPRKILGPAREATQAVVEQKMQLFGSTGKA